MQELISSPHWLRVSLAPGVKIKLENEIYMKQEPLPAEPFFQGHAAAGPAPAAAPMPIVFELEDPDDRGSPRDSKKKRFAPVELGISSQKGNFPLRPGVCWIKMGLRHPARPFW